ncbi:hypothetical protein RDI58_014001 [Solanum bulbocastanum]|uniref:Uncharacterized protein n=1 Tax=Solanum bulbocastanum TaxID=147425 RepID=A0AAN8TRB3_SOLBU
MGKSTIFTKSQTLLPLFFLGLLLNYSWMISATRSVDFSGHDSDSLSLSNEKSTIIVDHPSKISSDQQYMVNAHDVPSGANPIQNGCENGIC